MIFDIVVRETMCDVMNRTADVDVKLHGWLSVRQPGFQFSSAYKRGLWDGYVRFYKNGAFPAGLLVNVLYYAAEAGHVVNLVDRRGSIPVFKPFTPRGPIPRDYQKKAIEAVADAHLRELAWPRGCVVFPTAGGKTYVLEALAGSYPDELVLVATHRVELIVQLTESLKKALGEKIGTIYGGSQAVERVTVASLHSLHAQAKLYAPLLKRVGVLLMDECHHASANTFFKVLQSIPANVRIGVSATPFKKGDMVQTGRVVGAFGDVLFKVSPDEVRDTGVVAPVRIFFQDINEPTQAYCKAQSRMIPAWDMPYGLRKRYKQGGMKPTTAVDALIVNNAVRNRYVADFLMGGGDATTLCVVQRIEHGKLLSQMTGVPFVSGTETVPVRKAILKGLADGSITKLIASTIFDEGINVPSIRRLVLAAGGKSEIQLLQRIGRGMRKRRPEDRLEVLDFIDNTNKNLLAHSKERIKTAEAVHFEIFGTESIRRSRAAA